MFYPIELFEEKEELVNYISFLTALRSGLLTYPLSDYLRECVTFLSQQTTDSLEVDMEEVTKTDKTTQEEALQITRLTEQLQRLKEQLLKDFPDQSNSQHKDLLMWINWEIENLGKVWLPMAIESRNKRVVAMMREELARLHEQKHKFELLVAAASKKMDFNHYSCELQTKCMGLTIRMETKGVHAITSSQELERLTQEHIAFQEELKQRELQTKIDQIEHDIYRSEMKIQHNAIYAEYMNASVFADKRKEEILRKLANKGTSAEFSICVMCLSSEQDIMAPHILEKIFAPAILKLIDSDEVAIYGTDNYGNVSFRRVTDQEFIKLCPAFVFPRQENTVITKVMPDLVGILAAQRWHRIDFTLQADDLAEIDNDIIEAEVALKEMEAETAEEDSATEDDAEQTVVGFDDAGVVSSPKLSKKTSLSQQSSSSSTEPSTSTPSKFKQFATNFA